MEIAGWMQRQLKMQDGDWSLVLSNNVKLAVSLLLRGPFRGNVTLGIITVGDNDMDTLKTFIDPVKGAVRHQHSLRLVRWEERRACGVVT